MKKIIFKDEVWAIVTARKIQNQLKEKILLKSKVKNLFYILLMS